MAIWCIRPAPGLRLQPAPHHLTEPAAGAASLVESGAEFHAVGSTGWAKEINMGHFHGIMGKIGILMSFFFMDYKQSIGLIPYEIMGVTECVLWDRPYVVRVCRGICGITRKDFTSRT